MSRNNVSVAEHALTSASYEAGAKVAAEPIPGSTRSIMFPTLNDLFKLPAFYAEFAPLARHEGYVECIYLLKDCGVMTADCRSFSSPCSDIAFVFPQVDGVSRAPKIVADRPTFGHKERRRPFSGRIFDIKGGPSLPLNETWRDRRWSDAGIGWRRLLLRRRGRGFSNVSITCWTT